MPQTWGAGEERCGSIDVSDRRVAVVRCTFLTGLKRLFATTGSHQLCYCIDTKLCVQMTKEITVIGWTLAWRCLVLVCKCVHFREVGLGVEKTRKKCFALSHIPLKEFLDIKAGVMTVKVGKFLLTQRLSRTHLESRCVLPKCVSVVLCIPVLWGGCFFSVW